jgi:acetolactate synthase-1/2/3 large subunit
VNPSEVFRELRRQLPDDAIVANGAGNYAAWLHRFFEHRRFRTQLAPQSGAMGYGVPAAIAAALLHPERRVVAVAGDGCFMMAASELVTAAATGARVVFLVLNNGSYGTIRMHQETRFPGRTHATDLRNPDFVALAAACGIPAVRVRATAEFAPALATALAASGPRLIELVTSLEDIAPGRRLSALGVR